MPRVKSNVARLKRKNKVMQLAKGYFGGRSKLWKAAKESVERAQKYAYRDRRRKKGDFRRLWIIRINAAARLHRQRPEARLRGGVRGTRARAQARWRGGGGRGGRRSHDARPSPLGGWAAPRHAGRG